MHDFFFLEPHALLGLLTEKNKKIKIMKSYLIYLFNIMSTVI
jgi:hypothetical protein